MSPLSRLLRLPVRVQALAVAAGAGAESGFRHVPVPVAVRGVAVPAQPRIVVEPGRADLREAQRGPECPGDPAGPGGVDGVAAAVACGGPGEEQVPLSGRAAQETVPRRAAPLLPLGGERDRMASDGFGWSANQLPGAARADRATRTATGAAVVAQSPCDDHPRLGSATPTAVPACRNIAACRVLPPFGSESRYPRLRDTS
jgi:hypothetical protein